MYLSTENIIYKNPLGLIRNPTEFPRYLYFRLLHLLRLKKSGLPANSIDNFFYLCFN